MIIICEKDFSIAVQYVTNTDVENTDSHLTKSKLTYIHKYMAIVDSTTM